MSKSIIKTWQSHQPRRPGSLLYRSITTEELAEAFKVLMQNCAKAGPKMCGRATLTFRPGDGTLLHLAENCKQVDAYIFDSVPMAEGEKLVTIIMDIEAVTK